MVRASAKSPPDHALARFLRPKRLVYETKNAGGFVIVANQYEELVKLALFCANQARTSVMKDAAREAWRLAAEYRDQAAQLGEPPNIGKKPPHVGEL